MFGTELKICGLSRLEDIIGIEPLLQMRIEQRRDAFAFILFLRFGSDYYHIADSTGHSHIGGIDGIYCNSQHFGGIFFGEDSLLESLGRLDRHQSGFGEGFRRRTAPDIGRILTGRLEAGFEEGQHYRSRLESLCLMDCHHLDGIGSLRR